MRIFDIFRPRPKDKVEDELPDPLERIFYKQFKKYLSVDARILPHYELNTKVKIVPLNFLIEANQKRIVIEFQQEDSTDENEKTSKDSLIIGTNQIDSIYRFIGSDISPFIDDCIYFISQFDKDIFSPNYPQLNRALKYEEKDRTILYYNMYGEDDRIVYKLKLAIELVNRKTCKPLFALVDTI